MTLASYLFEALRSIGVDVVFGLPGVHALGLWSALEKSGLRYVGFRHEQAAAHAADAFGRVTGRPGIVLLSTGPGALNTISALAEARVSSSPVIAIASAIPTKYLGKQKGYLHETADLLAAFKVVCPFAARVTDPKEFGSILSRAIEASRSRRPGPAYIEIPMDLIDAETDAEPVMAELEPLSAREDVCEEAAKLLGLAARPVIWAGGGVLRSRASAELTMLAETLGAPVITTFMGKGAIPENHPLSVGTMVRQPETALLIRNSDLMLAVGTRFSGMSTSNWSLELPPQLVHIDVDEEEIGRNYPVRLGVTGDARLALQQISSRLADVSLHAFDRTEDAKRVRQASLDRARKAGPREMAFLEAVRSAVDPGVVFVHDMTIPSYWSAPFLEITVPGTFLYPYGYASLGFSFPASIGAAAAMPGAPVVCFTGDGGFQYHHRELAVIVENSLPITTIVWNDQAWGVLRAFSESRYETGFGMDIPSPDFVAIAEAYGIKGSRIEEPSELEAALKESVSSGEPRLIEVRGKWELPPPSDYYR